MPELVFPYPDWTSICTHSFPFKLTCLVFFFPRLHSFFRLFVLRFDERRVSRLFVNSFSIYFSVTFCIFIIRLLVSAFILPSFVCSSVCLSICPCLCLLASFSFPLFHSSSPFTSFSYHSPSCQRSKSSAINPLPRLSLKVFSSFTYLIFFQAKWHVSPLKVASERYFLLWVNYCEMIITRQRLLKAFCYHNRSNERGWADVKPEREGKYIQELTMISASCLTPEYLYTSP